ncbi:MAG: ATP-binding protein [Actinomycetota bacterium]
MRSHLETTVPAKQEYVQVLRTVVGSASSLLDATVETIQDLRLVVDEACGQLLAIGGEPSTFSMRLNLGSDRVEVVIATDGSATDWSQAPENPLADRILSALTDEYSFKRSPSPTVVLSKLLRTMEE